MALYTPRARHGATGAPLLERLFKSRGADFGLAQEKQALAGLLHPSGLKGLDEGAQYLADCVEAKKRIIVVADYDCDGATACAVAVRGLKMLGFDTVDYMVPNRFTDGYGLTPAIVQRVAAMQEPHDIIFTVDNGIASVDGVKLARELGLEVFITDHHLPGEALPPTPYIINPNQPGCTFASKSLAGVGVVFYLLMGLRAALRERGKFTRETQPAIERLLDLVALGTVADVVALDENNRRLVKAGLQAIRRGRCQAGMAALYQVCGKESRDAASTDMGFFIGPRINAAGRMDDMTVGIQCLLTDDFNEGLDLASRLNTLNRERRSVEGQMQSEASLLLQGVEVGQSHTIVMANEGWHQGVIGIVAGRLKEEHHRPTFVFADGATPDQPSWKGSGRSIPGFHLRDALDLVSKRHPGLILKFGGHAMAAGMTLRKEGLETFKAAFEQVAQELMEPHILTKEVLHDGGLEADEYSLDCARMIADQVWGQGFPEPLFFDSFVIEDCKIMAEKHLRLSLRPKHAPHIRLQGVWFKRTEIDGQEMQLAYRLSENKFRGDSSLQLIVDGGTATASPLAEKGVA